MSEFLSRHGMPLEDECEHTDRLELDDMLVAQEVLAVEVVKDASDHVEVHKLDCFEQVPPAFDTE